MKTSLEPKLIAQARPGQPDLFMHWDELELVLDLKTTAGKNALRVALANVQLLDRKQQDYGSKNISVFGTHGVLVRMTDKFERLKTLFTKRRKRSPRNESILDTFQDIANYSTIALMLETSQWPDE